MLRFKKTLFAVGLLLTVSAALWIATAPQRLPAKSVAAVSPGDTAAGERIFWTAGCASCHAAPGAKGENLLKLGGGLVLKTEFGSFVAPNISSDPEHGIGAWTFAEFANAVMRGVAPDGSHYYPAFPYPSYARMSLADTADLYAYMHTLPPVSTDPPPSQVPFPYSIRRGLGLWKLAFMRDQPIVPLAEGTDPVILRGRYLVEGPGHCGECHTPRNALGGTDYSRWLAGAPNPDGPGVIPDITPHADGLAEWSQGDIAYYLESGFTPDFDSVGGSMADVQSNMARLPTSDREAIAAYLKAIPALPKGYPAKH